MIVPAGTLAGLVLALGFVRVAHARGPASARRLYAVGLLVTALVYVAFALAGPADARWVALEGLGVVLFGGLSWLGVRRWPAALALGWAAHAVWDLALHRDGGGGAFTPVWYPWFCVSFDLALAGAVLVAGRRHPAEAARPAAERRVATDGAARARRAGSMDHARRSAAAPGR